MKIEKLFLAIVLCCYTTIHGMETTKKENGLRPSKIIPIKGIQGQFVQRMHSIGTKTFVIAEYPLGIKRAQMLWYDTATGKLLAEHQFNTTYPVFCKIITDPTTGKEEPIAIVIDKHNSSKLYILNIATKSIKPLEDPYLYPNDGLGWVPHEAAMSNDGKTIVQQLINPSRGIEFFYSFILWYGTKMIKRYEVNRPAFTSISNCGKLFSIVTISQKATPIYRSKNGHLLYQIKQNRLRFHPKQPYLYNSKNTYDYTGKMKHELGKEDWSLADFSPKHYLLTASSCTSREYRIYDMKNQKDSGINLEYPSSIKYPRFSLADHKQYDVIMIPDAEQTTEHNQVYCYKKPDSKLLSKIVAFKKKIKEKQ